MADGEMFMNRLRDLKNRKTFDVTEISRDYTSVYYKTYEKHVRFAILF